MAFGGFGCFIYRSLLLRRQYDFSKTYSRLSRLGVSLRTKFSAFAIFKSAMRHAIGSTCVAFKHLGSSQARLTSMLNTSHRCHSGASLDRCLSPST